MDKFKNRLGLIILFLALGLLLTVWRMYQTWFNSPFMGRYVLLSYGDDLGETPVTLMHKELEIARRSATETARPSKNCIFVVTYEGMKVDESLVKFDKSKSSHKGNCEATDYSDGPGYDFKARKSGQFLYWQKSGLPYTEKYQAISETPRTE